MGGGPVPAPAPQAPKAPEQNLNKDPKKDPNKALDAGTRTDVSKQAPILKKVETQLGTLGVKNRAQKLIASLEEKAQELGLKDVNIIDTFSKFLDNFMAETPENERLIAPFAKLLNNPSIAIAKVADQITEKFQKVFKQGLTFSYKECVDIIKSITTSLDEEKEEKEREKERKRREGDTSLNQKQSKEYKELVHEIERKLTSKEAKESFAKIQDKWNGQQAQDLKVMSELSKLDKKILNDPQTMEKLSTLLDKNNFNPSVRHIHDRVAIDILESINNWQKLNQGDSETCVGHAALSGAIKKAVITGDTTALNNVLDSAISCYNDASIGALKDTSEGSYIGNALKDSQIKGWSLVTAINSQAYQDFTSKGETIGSKNNRTYTGSTDRDIAEIYKAVHGEYPKVISNEEISSISMDKLEELLKANPEGILVKMKWANGSHHAVLVTGINKRHGLVTFANSQSEELVKQADGNAKVINSMSFDKFKENAELLFVNDALDFKTVSIDDLSDDPGTNNWTKNDSFRNSSNSNSSNDSVDLSDIGEGYQGGSADIVRQYSGYLTAEELDILGADWMGVGITNGQMGVK